ncbi:MAG: hypothetical protein NTV34_20420 [Proteobacteria bacterium]|nr:hypothetical protein [Pseudomonadota bacterium]
MQTNFKEAIIVRFLYIFCSFAFLICGSVHAEITVEAPDARKWLDSLNEAQLKSIIAAKVVAVVESFGGEDSSEGPPKFLAIDFESCKLISYFDCISPANANFSAVLNSGPTSKGVPGVFNITGADTVVFVKEKKVFISGDEGKTIIETKIKANDFQKINLKILADGILTGLGYDGVILAVNDEHVLVGSTERRLKRVNLQALAISASQAKWSLGETQKKGASLLTLVNRSGPYAVFQLVVGEKKGDDLSVGTKIILESK